MATTYLDCLLASKPDRQVKINEYYNPYLQEIDYFLSGREEGIDIKDISLVFDSDKKYICIDTKSSYKLYIGLYEQLKVFPEKVFYDITIDSITSKTLLNNIMATRDLFELELDSEFYNEFGGWYRHLLGIRQSQQPSKREFQSLYNIDIHDIVRPNTSKIWVTDIERFSSPLFDSIIYLLKPIGELDTLYTKFCDTLTTLKRHYNVDTLIPNSDGKYSNVDYLNNNTHLLTLNETRHITPILQIAKTLFKEHKASLYYDSVNEVYWIDLDNTTLVLNLEDEDIETLKSKSITERTMPLRFGGGIFD